MRPSVRHLFRVGLPVALLALTLVLVLPKAGSRSALAGDEVNNGAIPNAIYCGPLVGATISGGEFCITTNSTATGIVAAELRGFPEGCGTTATYDPAVPIVNGSFLHNGTPFNFQGTFQNNGGGDYSSEAKFIAGDGEQMSPDIVGLFSAAVSSECSDATALNQLRTWNAFFSGTVEPPTPTPTVTPTSTSTVTPQPCTRGCTTVTVTPTGTVQGCGRTCNTSTPTPTATAGCGRSCSTVTVTPVVTATPTGTATPTVTVTPVCTRNCGKATVTPTATPTATQCPRGGCAPIVSSDHND